ncbi:hypothetical protein [Archangium sp.]
MLGTDSSPVTFKGSAVGYDKWRGIRVESGTTTVLTSALIRATAWR